MVLGMKRLFHGSASNKPNATKPKAVPSPVAIAKAPLRAQPPTIFGLLIGIDKYRNPKYQLEGAVEDAKAVEGYLRTTFPSSHIRTLHNQEATRNAMIREILDLIHNKKIKRQDPIVIFYAGHGGETMPPAGWDTQGRKIQMFMPQDYNDDGTVITDLGFATLLEELASVKGDNILVILDCCHSGSMTRGRPEESGASGTRRTRAIRITNPLPSDVDQDILRRKGTRSTSVPTLFQYNGTASHVLLAACAANELAIEEGGRGAFTRAFLKTITEIGYENLTYAEIIRRLPPLNKQSPRCEGDNRDRFFFDPNTPIRDSSFFEVQMEGRDLVVKAGTVHGISNATEFALYQRPDKNIAPIGFFGVRSAKASTSTLKVTHSMPSISLPAYAIPTKVSRIAFAHKPNLNTVVGALQGDMAATGFHLHQLSIVPRDQAAVEVDLSSRGDVVFNSVNPRLHALRYSRMPYHVKMGETKIIRSILQGAGDFDRFLNLAPASRTLRDFIKVEFVRITRPSDRHYGPAVQHGNGHNLAIGDLVEIPAGDTLYGIKVTNNSSVQLYPHLFLFDCSDLSIDSFYRPPLVMNEDKDAPLQPGGGVLTIGYGTGGEKPWSHYVRDEDTFQQGKVLQDAQDLDVGIFKLFLTTKPVDLSPLEQESPFLGNERAVRKLNWGDLDDWDTVSLYVSVRR